MDKTDRELLQAAATAAGYSVARLSDDDSALFLVGVQQAWNPLTDDGDALRLAVKLRIDVKCFGATVRTWVGDPVAQRVIASIEEVCGDDPYAATRRAIVRAAAAIGEKQ
jgi:hypothetical protein